MTAGPRQSGTLQRLEKRPAFLRAARGRRVGRVPFTLQAVGTDLPLARIGFTVTNRTGNAPERNRIRRRLREAVRACAPAFEPRHDYVLIGRREALRTPFGSLVEELSTAIATIHASTAARRRNER